MRLEIDRLHKTYANNVHALRGVSLSIGAGMFGLLGPNGSGKSTLMRTIATLQPPDSGSIRFGDIDVLAQPDELRRMLGYMPQEFGFYPGQTAEATLDHFATLKGVTNRSERREQVHGLLHQTNLYSDRKTRVGTFSGGMKQRLGIAVALAGQPRLLIVDEPTAGLDPMERRRFLNLLAEIGRDVVVVLSTHIVEDVRELCSEMAIINDGAVLLTGNPVQLVEAARGKIWKKFAARDELGAMRQQHQVISVRMMAGQPVVHVYGDINPGEGFAPAETDLEDVYFQQIGTAATAAAVFD